MEEGKGEKRGVTEEEERDERERLRCGLVQHDTLLGNTKT